MRGQRLTLSICGFFCFVGGVVDLFMFFRQIGTVRSTSGSGATITTRFPALRARGRHSEEGSEVGAAGEEGGEDEAEEVAEVCDLFYLFFPAVDCPTNKSRVSVSYPHLI